MAKLFVVCPQCQRKLEVLEEWRGMEVSCPDCRIGIAVPEDLAPEAPKPVLPEDEDRDIGVCMPKTPVPAESARSQEKQPIYFQETASKTARKIQARKKSVGNWIIKSVFSLILLAALALGGWFALKHYFYFRSGFHEVKTVDGVSLRFSGNGFYLEAEKVGQAYSGRVSSDPDDSGKWMTVEFKKGKAHGTAFVYERSVDSPAAENEDVETDGKDNAAESTAKEDNADDKVLYELTFVKGRLKSIKNRDGEVYHVKYDRFDRPQSLECKKSDGKEIFWKCSYTRTGLPENVTATSGKTVLKSTFNDSLFPDEIVYSNDGETAWTAKFDYNAEKKFKSVTVYDNQGKKKEIDERAFPYRGAGPLHILLK